MNDIKQRILEYKQAYSMLGIQDIDIPAYRITCKEHKELVNTCKRTMLKPIIEDGEFKVLKVDPTSMIARYHGVELEVVMIVDEYL